jgi:ferrochelatase
MRFIDEGDPYREDIDRTVAGIRERLPRKNPWRLAFQSRTGPVKWMGPGTDEVLRELAAAGEKNVLVIPVSFVSDHIETLYEVDLLFGELAKELGMDGYRRIDSLNDHEGFLDALADLAEGSLR